MQQTKEIMYDFTDWRNAENYNNLMEGLFLRKEQIQDQRIDELYKKVDDLNRRVNISPPDWNKYIRRYLYNEMTLNKDILDNETLSKEIMNNSEQNNLFSNIVAEVRKLEGLDDIRDQIAYCVSVCDNTLNLLKKYNDSNDDNYSKRLLHLFYQIIKRNYSKFLFTHEQVAVMLDMIKTVKTPFVDADKYWKYDEILYSVGLDSFPEEE